MPNAKRFVYVLTSVIADATYYGGQAMSAGVFALHSGDVLGYM